MTGTPLSEERGMIDAYDLLRFLGCTAPLAASRSEFASALEGWVVGRGGGEGERGGGREAVFALLRTLTWRTSQAYAYEQLGIAPPMPHAVGVSLTCAELAWATRDVLDFGVSEAGRELPPDPHAPGRAPSAAPSAAPPPPPPPPPRYELQRALTHVQLSRAWIALGRSEAQLETGTSIAHLEQLQRAAELLIRRKQTAELELCHELNTAASWHKVLGELEEARSLHERVLRIHEWGIVENESAGDQQDNAEETLRRWRLERCHTLFRLLCLHRDAGRNDAADDASSQLREVEVEIAEESSERLQVVLRGLRRVTAALNALLPQVSRLTGTDGVIRVHWTVEHNPPRFRVMEAFQRALTRALEESAPDFGRSWLERLGDELEGIEVLGGGWDWV